MDPSFPYFDEKIAFPFPSVEEATVDGVVAVGGNLSPGMLLSAYRQGIFPWYSDGEPVLWWSPDPRLVLYPEKIHVSRSMIRTFKRNYFAYTTDRSFELVMRSCGEVKREGQNSTWITGEMVEGYTLLHKLGFAHSVEVWMNGELAGGLYGVSLGTVFFGESMFSRVADASKAGYILLVRALARAGFSLIDCQVYTPHLVSLGAENISRKEYLNQLGKGLKGVTRKGNWNSFVDLNKEREYLLL